MAAHGAVASLGSPQVTAACRPSRAATMRTMAAAAPTASCAATSGSRKRVGGSSAPGSPGPMGARPSARAGRFRRWAPAPPSGRWREAAGGARATPPPRRGPAGGIGRRGGRVEHRRRRRRGRRCGPRVRHEVVQRDGEPSRGGERTQQDPARGVRRDPGAQQDPEASCGQVLRVLPISTAEATIRSVRFSKPTTGSRKPTLSAGDRWASDSGASSGTRPWRMEPLRLEVEALHVQDAALAVDHQHGDAARARRTGPPAWRRSHRRSRRRGRGACRRPGHRRRRRGCRPSGPR